MASRFALRYQELVGFSAGQGSGYGLVGYDEAKNRFIDLRALRL